MVTVGMERLERYLINQVCWCFTRSLWKTGIDTPNQFITGPLVVELQPSLPSAESLSLDMGAGETCACTHTFVYKYIHLNDGAGKCPGRPWFPRVFKGYNVLVINALYYPFEGKAIPNDHEKIILITFPLLYRFDEDLPFESNYTWFLFISLDHFSGLFSDFCSYTVPSSWP